MALPKNQRNPTNRMYTTDPAAAERAAEGIKLRAQGLTYAQIAAQLGYADKAGAWRAIAAATAKVVREATDELIAVERAELDKLYVAACELIESEHQAVAQGKAVYDDAGQPIYDAQPKIAAINAAVKIRESYRKLLGLDQPAKQEISGGVRYEITGVDPGDLT